MVLQAVYSKLTTSTSFSNEPCDRSVNKVEHFEPAATAAFKYALVANFKNNEEIMPSFIHQVGSVCGGVGVGVGGAQYEEPGREEVRACVHACA